LQFLLENSKKRIYSYKVALKNFHGRAKGGGHRTVALPQNTPLDGVDFDVGYILDKCTKH